MFSPIVFLAVTLIIVQAELSPRIVDGGFAKEGQFPYIAQIKGNDFCYCGGSIIGPKTILTAAHCLNEADLENLSVTVGSNSAIKGGKTYNVESFVYHEGYKTNPVRNDVGIIKLTEEIEFDDNIKQIELNKDDIYEYKFAVTAGWGSIDSSQKNVSDELKYANMQVLAKDQCERYRNLEAVQDACFVSQHGNICYGDSGGPLATESGEKLLGITSWGWHPCGTNSPGIFARVDYFIDWIEEHMD